MPRTRKWRPGRGAVALIAGLLIGSAVIRLGSGSGVAIAREFAPPEVIEESVVDRGLPQAVEISPLLEALQAREAAVQKQERQIEDRMKALSMAEDAVDQKLAALVEAEARLRDTLALADGAAENDLARLTAVYENMKPKEAAELFEQMAPEFAAGFLGRMRPDAAAGIMAGLSAETAYAISVYLASRNADAPKD